MIAVLARAALVLAASAPRRAVLPKSCGAATSSGAADDPIYRDELWLDTKTVRYTEAQGSGIGHLVSYSPSTRAGNHSRAVLMLAMEPYDEEALCALAGRVALSCECVALVPFLRGGLTAWPPERLASEAWSATSFLNAGFGAESLAIVAVGGVAPTTLALLADGALGAHAFVALCPSGDPDTSGRVARELPIPILAVCPSSTGGDVHATVLRDALALNSRLRSDYYVAAFDGCSADFVLGPRDEADVRAAERALSLMQGWVDRYCPEKLQPANRPNLQ